MMAISGLSCVKSSRSSSYPILRALASGSKRWFVPINDPAVKNAVFSKKFLLEGSFSCSAIGGKSISRNPHQMGGGRYLPKKHRFVTTNIQRVVVKVKRILYIVLKKYFYKTPIEVFNPDFAVGFVTRRSKPQRNAQLERFCDAGIIIIMLRSKIAKQALQQGFASRSRWLLQILGLIIIIVFIGYNANNFICFDFFLLFFWGLSFTCFLEISSGMSFKKTDGLIFFRSPNMNLVCA